MKFAVEMPVIDHSFMAKIEPRNISDDYYVMLVKLLPFERRE